MSYAFLTTQHLHPPTILVYTSHERLLVSDPLTGFILEQH